jgi:nucleoid DNA-binding protein
MVAAEYSNEIRKAENRFTDQLIRIPAKTAPHFSSTPPLRNTLSRK